VADTSQDVTIASSIMQLEEDMDKLQKEQEQNARDHQAQIKKLTKKNNDMQTQFENAKMATAMAQNKAKEAFEKKAATMEEIKNIEKTIEERN